METVWGAAPGSAEAHELEVLVTLVDAYEEKTHPIEPPDRVDALIFPMEQAGMTRAELATVRR